MLKRLWQAKDQLPFAETAGVHDNLVVTISSSARRPSLRRDIMEQL